MIHCKYGLTFSFLFFGLFVFSKAAPSTYGGSQARGLIRAVATSLRQSHSNAGSKPGLRLTPQQYRILNPLSKAWEKRIIYLTFAFKDWAISS